MERATRRIKRLKDHINIYDVNITEVYEYCDSEMRFAEKKRKSLRIEMEHLKRWMKFKEMPEELIARIPHFKKEPSPEPYYPSDAEMDKILLVCDQKITSRDPSIVQKWTRTKCMVEVMAYGGLRVSEVRRLNIEDIVEEGLFVRSSKGERDGHVALPPHVIEHLWEYVADHRVRTDRKALFTTESGRIPYQVVRNSVADLSRITGLKKLHPHSFRHYCGTRLLASGVDLRKIQVHLGHSSIQSTQRYTHLLSTDVQVEIYELYSRVRELDFFEYEEGIAI